MEKEYIFDYDSSSSIACFEVDTEKFTPEHARATMQMGFENLEGFAKVDGSVGVLLTKCEPIYFMESLLSVKTKNK